MKKIFAFCLFTISTLLGFAQTGTNVVISQVYGGGGNSGSVYTHDFIELFNPTSTAISLNGWSVQYNSATGTGTWQVTNLTNFSLQPGQYYLIQQAVGTGGSTALPTPNATGVIAMSGTAGKVALVSNSTALTGACPAGLVDLVGFGVTANCFEGAGASPAPSNSNSIIRATNGCTDANNNSTDFTSVLAAPRNSASPFNVCGGGGGSPALSINGTLVNFGNITVGNNSTAQTFSISGSNLTGTPGVITITAPSTDFQVSNNNSTWGASTTITYTTATLNATTVYVRFIPQSAGIKSGNITISGGGVTAALTVPVSGTGVAAAIPTLTAGSLAGFGNVCINATAGPVSFNLTGINLNTTAIQIGPLSGFSFATIASGPFSASLHLTQPGGSFSQTIYVIFMPTAIGSYNGNITVSGGGASSILIAATGAGDNSIPTLTTGSASAINTVSATCAGMISGIGCSAITAYGIEYSTTLGFTPGTGIKVTANNLIAGNFSSALSGLQPATNYYYRAFATNSGGTGYGNQLSFSTSYPTLIASTIPTFGNVCINTTTAPNTFTLTGTGLTTAPINIGPLNGYSFSTSATGTFTNSLNITQPGGNYSQVIYVAFSPVATISYNGFIPISGGSALPFIHPVSGDGANNPPAMGSGTVGVVQAYSANISGIISGTGCSAVTDYGITFSGINGFSFATGKKVSAINLLGNNFSAILTGLVPNTTYYYTVFATNTGGTGYGTQQSFTTPALKDGFVIYNNPIMPGGNLHFTISDLKPAHYAIQIINRLGQLVYQKDMIISGNYIDVTIPLPQRLPLGNYTLQVGTVDQIMKKSFAIQ